MGKMIYKFISILIIITMVEVVPKLPSSFLINLVSLLKEDLKVEPITVFERYPNQSVEDDAIKKVVKITFEAVLHDKFLNESIEQNSDEDKKSKEIIYIHMPPNVIKNIDFETLNFTISVTMYEIKI